MCRVWGTEAHQRIEWTTGVKGLLSIMMMMIIILKSGEAHDDDNIIILKSGDADDDDNIIILKSGDAHIMMMVNIIGICTNRLPPLIKSG